MATNSQAAHSFAHNLKTSRRGSNCHWTELPNGSRVFYSYGWYAVCAISGEYVFWNADQFSQSTRRQALHVWRALTPDQRDRMIVTVKPERWASRSSSEILALNDLGREARSFASAIRSGMRARTLADYYARSARVSLTEAGRLIRASTRILEDLEGESGDEWNSDLLERFYDRIARRLAVCTNSLDAYFWALILKTARDWQSIPRTAETDARSYPCLATSEGLESFALEALADSADAGERIAGMIEEGRKALPALEARAERQEKTAEQRRAESEAKQRERTAKVMAEQRPRFLAGEISGVSYGPAIIRLDRDRRKIQTSAGMTIDLDALSVRAMDALAYALEYPETPAPERVSLPVSGQSVSFNVRRDGSDLRIGCHVFSSSDLDLIRPVMAEALELAGGVS